MAARAFADTLTRMCPLGLRQAIQQEIENTDPTELAKAVLQLIRRYKAECFSSTAIATAADQAAYLAVRMPATFGANVRVLGEIARLTDDLAVTSLLDLGAGPGTSAFAAAEVFSSLSRVTLVEGKRSLIQLGRRLSRENQHPAIRDSVWLQQDLKNGLNFDRHDLVIISYTLNELASADAQRVILQAWDCTREILAIVEPGTPRGFASVNAARSALIAAGARLIAPCPHAKECPMAATNDWCHFAQRVERTSMHRRLKSGALGYEDEKFSYVVVSRRVWPRAAARIVRHPQKHGRHVQLTLCTPQGLERRTATRSQKETYKLARKVEWGDAWD